MPVDFNRHSEGDRLPGHEPEVWPQWDCRECGGTHESDPRLGCPGFKAPSAQPTLEAQQGKAVHGEIATPAAGTPARKLPTSTLADRIAASNAPAATPVLLDSIRMIVREELQLKGAHFATKERHAIVQGLLTVQAFFEKNERTAEDDVLFPSAEELAALILRIGDEE
jgi:hypothetical protein